MRNIFSKKLATLVALLFFIPTIVMADDTRNYHIRLKNNSDKALKINFEPNGTKANQGNPGATEVQPGQTSPIYKFSVKYPRKGFINLMINGANRCEILVKSKCSTAKHCSKKASECSHISGANDVEKVINLRYK